MKLSDIKTRLRLGEYAWPGGYPCFFFTADGSVLSFATVRAEWRCVVAAHLSHDKRSGWYVDGVDVNWEDNALFDDHTGKRIESAYGEDE
jgi:hypothetical protein